MQTVDFIEAIRSDIKRDLRQEIMAELQPVIQKMLYANIFDFAEACKYLKISDSTLRKRVKSGEVPHFWQRGQMFFRQVDLDKSIAKSIVGGPK